MLENILAKSIENGGESLVEHTDEIIKRWNVLKLEYAHLGLSDFFWEQSFLSVLFHDSGKIAKNFQDKIWNRVKNYDKYIRHEFLSGILLMNCDKHNFLDFPLSILAIFSHHKPLTDNLFLRERNRILEVNVLEMGSLSNYLNEKMMEQNVEMRVSNNLVKAICQEQKLEGHYINFRNFLGEVSVGFTPKTRIEYINYKAILNIADWTASGGKVLGSKYNYTPNTLRDKTIEKLKSEGKNDPDKPFKWKDFQISCQTQNSHVLAIAPTGSGKTEAALLWSSNKQDDEKIIYLLPTRVTSNSIYDRLSQYFGKENTSVVHSSAFFYQKELDDNQNYHKGNYLVEKTFFKNVNVCTIDQVLTQGFNLGYWEIKTFNMKNAWVVIDEIHLYSPYTLGLIISTIRYLKDNFGARFFIMTATMPKKLQDLLIRTLDIPESSVLKDLELLEKRRNIFETRNSVVDDLNQEIIKEIKAFQKVLIVVNTVDEAIRLYKKYKGIAKKTICYHSRFIQLDRLKKEKEILTSEKECESLLLIATQVVEVSLDIDFDILFTENAPIDAIIQRAGRVNRRRGKEGTKVVVFKEQDVSREVIYTQVDGILERTFKELEALNGHKLSEKKLVSLVDRVYLQYEVEKENWFIDGMKAYSAVQEKLHYVKDNAELNETYTREGIDTVNVIPAKFKHELQNASIMEKAKHEVSISRKKYLIFKNKVEEDKDHSWYKYLDKGYSDETGLDLTKKKSEPIEHTKIF